MTGTSPTGDFSPLPCKEGFLGKSHIIKNKKSQAKTNTYILTICLINIFILILLYNII